MASANRARAALTQAVLKAHQRAEGPPRTTRDALAAWARAHMPGRDLLVLSNREPWSHAIAGEGPPIAVRNAGGLTVALDAVMQALGGVWVAHGSGDADRATVDEHDRVACPP